MDFVVDFCRVCYIGLGERIRGAGAPLRVAR
jgi:hypothetical protein